MNVETDLRTPESDLAFARGLIDADRILSRLLRYWASKAAAARIPKRNDIDPTEIPEILPHLMIVDPAEEGGFRCRLCGTAVAESYGRELRGKTFDEAFTAAGAARAAAHCRLVFTLRRPVVVHNTYANARGNPLVANRLLLPLADDGVTVTKVLVGFRSHSPAQFRAPFGGPLFLNQDFVAPLAMLEAA